MSPLYGTGRKIVGIHHTKAIYLTGDRFRRLWIGSANFTSASEYNKELMVELTQLTRTERDETHPVLEMFRQQFDELLNNAPPKLGESEARCHSYRNRYSGRGGASPSALPAPVIADMRSRNRSSGPSGTVPAQAARIPPPGCSDWIGPREYSSDPSPYANVYYAVRSRDAAVCEVDEALHRELQPYVVFGSKFRGVVLF